METTSGKTLYHYFRGTEYPPLLRTEKHIHTYCSSLITRCHIAFKNVPYKVSFKERSVAAFLVCQFPAVWCSQATLQGCLFDIPATVLTNLIVRLMPFFSDHSFPPESTAIFPPSFPRGNIEITIPQNHHEYTLHKLYSCLFKMYFQFHIRLRISHHTKPCRSLYLVAFCS